MVFHSDEDKDYEDLVKINPDLIDFDVASSSHVGCEIGIARATVNNFLFSNDEFHEMCYQLFVILTYAIKYQLSKKYDDPKPDVFLIFLSGCASVGKNL